MVLQKNMISGLKERLGRIPTEVIEERERTKAAFKEIAGLAPKFREVGSSINFTSATLSGLLEERAHQGYDWSLTRQAVEAFDLGGNQPLKVFMSADYNRQDMPPQGVFIVKEHHLDPFSKNKTKIEFDGRTFQLGIVSNRYGFVVSPDLPESAFAKDQKFLTQFFEAVRDDLKAQRERWVNLLRKDRDAYSLEMGRTVHGEAPVYIDSLLTAMRQVSPDEKFVVFGVPADRRDRDLPLIRLLTSMKIDEEQVNHINGYQQSHEPFYSTTTRADGRNHFQRRYDRDYRHSSGFLPHGLTPQNYGHDGGTYTLTFPDFAVSLECLTPEALYDLAVTYYPYKQSTGWGSKLYVNGRNVTERLFARFLAEGRDEEIYPAATRKKITLLTVQPNNFVFEKPFTVPEK